MSKKKEDIITQHNRVNRVSDTEEETCIIHINDLHVGTFNEGEQPSLAEQVLRYATSPSPVFIGSGSSLFWVYQSIFTEHLHRDDVGFKLRSSSLGLLEGKTEEVELQDARRRLAKVELENELLKSRVHDLQRNYDRERQLSENLSERN